MEGLRADDHVHRPGPQRDPLGGGQDGGGAGQPLDEVAQHRLERVGGQHPVAQRRQLLGEPPGARPQLQDVRVGAPTSQAAASVG